MKFSFSTKGWHNYSFDDFCAIAKDLKFDGIELHNINNRLFTDKDGAFHDYTAAKTVRKLFEQKLNKSIYLLLKNPVDEINDEEKKI
jgi:fatty-acyl-CoA synthase